MYTEEDCGVLVRKVLRKNYLRRFSRKTVIFCKALFFLQECFYFWSAKKKLTLGSGLRNNSLWVLENQHIEISRCTNKRYLRSSLKSSFLPSFGERRSRKTPSWESEKNKKKKMLLYNCNFCSRTNIFSLFSGQNKIKDQLSIRVLQWFHYLRKKH